MMEKEMDFSREVGHPHSCFSQKIILSAADCISICIVALEGSSS